MSLDHLDTPVRLTWDFPGLAEPSGVDLSGIARRIAEGGAFYVTLQGRPLKHPQLVEILAGLQGCQQFITCGGDVEELVSLAGLSGSSCQLLLDLSGFVTDHGTVSTARLAEVVHGLRDVGFEPIPCLTPLRKNLCVIPALLRFCDQYGIARFKLPNAHIGDSFHEYSADDLPRWQDLENFRETWDVFATGAPEIPEMEIHDLFLWEIMTPGQQQNRSEYGGCQAANSLGHVDCHGVVHPCAAWPRPLGRLPEQSLEEIWSGGERMAVRNHIAASPKGCDGCNALDICFGGCRGLAFHLNKSAGERDLMCSGPR